MRATDFEVRHQTLLHLLVVGAAFLTYAFQRDDVVWGFIKNHGDRIFLERVVFGIGTLMIFGSAILQTRARVYGAYPLYFGRIIFAMGLGLLAPASGSAVLLIGESILVLRLLNRERSSDPLAAHPRRWTEALRLEFSKWGLAFTMVVFTVTLKDRLAETLAATSFFLWFVLNLPDFLRSRRSV